MRVLILSCDTGGGHNACARAIQEAFLECGCHCDVADSVQFVSEKLSKFMSWGHTTMYRHIPGLFRFGYGFAEKHPKMLQDEASVYKLLTGGTEQLHAYIQEGKYDSVICSHVFSGLLLRQTLKEYPMELKTAFVATDYTCSPGTARSELDHYFIPSRSLTAEFIAQGDKAKAKRKLGIDPNHTHLLMMCGSMGCGPLEKLTKLLSNSMTDTMELSIVCGTNEKLRSELAEEFGNQPNIHIHGFVRDISTMMDGADLYLTKPGGLSTTEAAAKGLPMVFINAVAGCEEYNLNYYVRLGGAVTADSPEELAQLCLNLMGNPNRLAQLQAALKVLPKQNAAQFICETMCADEKAGVL